MSEKSVQVGVAAFVVNKQGQLLLVRRIGRSGADMWAPFGGHQEYGEAPNEAAARELREESGLELAPSDFTALGFCSDVLEDIERHYVTLFYAAVMPDNQEPHIMEPDVHAEILWTDMENLPYPLMTAFATFLESQSRVLENYIEQVRQQHAA